MASDSSKPKKIITYDAQRIIGQGSFGAVFYTRVVETDEIVAIKKVLQDPHYKNRELQIMRQLKKQPHPYIVQLKHYFSSKAPNSQEVYLNLVLEYVPETLYSVNRYYTKRKEIMPAIFIKIYTYQMFRALAHIHGMGIVHRDLKPQNLLVNPVTHTLKLCDFGSGKILVKGETNVAYICSRFYRAPELIIAGDSYIPYTSAIDVWSAGCVLCELLMGGPIFPGISARDQLIEIVKILGTPSDEDIAKINVAKHNVAIPQFQPCPLGTLFKKASPEIIDLVQNTLKCVPDKRLSSICAVASTAFDELRDPSTLLPDGSPISLVMWQFTNEELSMATPEVAANLYPVPEDLSNSSSESQIADSLSELVKTISLSPRPHSADTTAENSLNSQMIQNGNNEPQSTT